MNKRNFKLVINYVKFNPRVTRKSIALPVEPQLLEKTKLGLSN